ncbi:MAG: DMT family transporter [Kiritimatiellia bacterium]|jgi:drug/metabolite transporter (DMT)-like permease|nr:DMT family transporter [Kiritimatiellia bacterium]MDP6848213.1 DMT family transporter [Kiritimatiellia bacterium]
MANVREERFTAYICLAGAILGFSSVPLFIKHFAASLDAWTVNAVRYSTASVILAPVALVIYARNRERSRGIWLAALVPAMPNLIGQIGWALTPYYNDASVIAFVIRSSFLFTILFGCAFLPSERALARIPGFWLGAAICCCGIVVMYAASIFGQRGTSAFGIGLIVATAMMWGIYGVSVRIFLRGYPGRLGFGVVAMYTTFGLLIAACVRAVIVSEPSGLATLSTPDWFLLLLSGLIGIAISHVLMYKAIHALGPITASGVQLVSPFLTSMGAALILHEKMGSLQWLGGVLLIAGLLTLVIARSRAVSSEDTCASHQEAVLPVDCD